MNKSTVASSIPLFGLLMGTLFALIWSGSFIASKMALPLAPPLWLAAARLCAASLILWPFVGFQALRILRTASPTTKVRLIGSAALTQSYYLGAVFYVLDTLPAALVSVVGSSLPLVSIPVAIAILGERSSRSELLVTIVAVISIGVVILGRNSPPELSEEVSSVAVVLMLSAVSALAIGNTLLKPVAEEGELLSLIAIQMSIGSGLLILLAALVEGEPYFRPTVLTLSAFLYLIVIGSIVGMWLWVLLLRQFSAIRASAFFLATPIFGIALGYIFLGEVLTPIQLGGTGVLCLMILIRSLLGRPQAVDFPEN